MSELFWSSFYLLLVYSVVSFVLWIYQIEKRYRRFAEKQIVGPKPSFILGNLLQVRSGLQHEIFEEWMQEYGETFAFHTPFKSYIVTKNFDILRPVLSQSQVFSGRPEIVLKVKPLVDSLLCKRGQEWLNARKAVSPVFSHSKVNSPPISTIIDECVQRFMLALASDHQESFEVDVGDLFSRFTLDTILKTSLDMKADVYSKDDLLSAAVREYFDGAHNNAVLIAEAVPVLRPIMRLINDNITAGKMTDLVLNHLKSYINKFLNNSDKNPGESGAVLLRTLLEKTKQGKLSKEEFLGNLHLMVLAAYEATSNGLTYALYLLAKHQDIQKHLRSCLMEKGDDHPYLSMVWLEALRYYPPITGMVARETFETTTIAGLTIEKGTCIVAPVWQIHHDARFWPDPWIFDPERFNSENRSQRDPTTFLAYGCGPKTCLGINLANMEARRLLSSILTRYEVSFSKKTINPLKFRSVAEVIIKPSDPVILKFESIQSS